MTTASNIRDSRKEHDVLFTTLPTERQNVHIRVLLGWLLLALNEGAIDVTPNVRRIEVT
jgi:hypothetical protein